MLADSYPHPPSTRPRATTPGLMVVARRSRHSLHGAVLGRVPVHLLAHARCPVAIVPAGPAAPWWSSLRDAVRNVAKTG